MVFITLSAILYRNILIKAMVFKMSDILPENSISKPGVNCHNPLLPIKV